MAHMPRGKILQLLADHSFVEAIAGAPLAGQISAKIYQRHYPNSTNPASNRSVHAGNGWITVTDPDRLNKTREKRWLVTGAVKEHLEAEGIRPTLTRDDAQELIGGNIHQLSMFRGEEGEDAPPTPASTVVIVGMEQYAQLIANLTAAQFLNNGQGLPRDLLYHLMDDRFSTPTKSAILEELSRHAWLKTIQGRVTVTDRAQMLLRQIPVAPMDLDTLRRILQRAA